MDQARMVPRLGWGVLALFAVAFGILALRYLAFDPEVAPEELRQNLLDHPAAFYTHAITAALALIVGVWQFLPATRRSAWHRYAGRTYAALAIVGGITGFVISLSTETGPAAGIGFSILAVLWLAATAIGVAHARSRDFDSHRVWMIRSYALAAAAISLRIYLSVGAAVGVPFDTAYIFAAWASWIGNLAIAEVIVRRGRAAGRVAGVPAE